MATDNTEILSRQKTLLTEMNTVLQSNLTISAEQLRIDSARAQQAATAAGNASLAATLAKNTQSALAGIGSTRINLDPGGNISGTSGTIRELDGLLGNVIGTADGAGRAVSALGDKQLERRIQALQKTLGGFGPMGTTQAEYAGRMTKAYAGLNQALYGTNETGQYLRRMIGNTNSATAAFKLMTEGTQGAVDGLALMKQATPELLLEMGVFGRGMGLSAQKTSVFVTRAISLNKKSATEMLRNSAVYAQRIAKQTGDSAKAIMNSMSQIIESTQYFGNVMPKEAAKISGTLRQIGIDFRDLQGMVSKYSSFESAVQSVSALTSVFGVNIDAMEAMKLANTDQLGFLNYMRDQFLLTGKSVDDLTLAEKRLIKSQLNLTDIESVERLFDPTADITSMADLEAAAGAPAESFKDAFAEIQGSVDVFVDGSEVSINKFAGVVLGALTTSTNEATQQVKQDFSDIAGAATNTLGGVGGIAGKALERELGPLLTTVSKNISEGFVEAFGDPKIQISFKNMINDLIQQIKDSGLWAQSPSDVGAMVASGFTEAFKTIPPEAQKEFEKIEDISEVSLKRMLSDTDSYYGAAAKNVSKLGFEYRDLDEEGRRNLATQLKLGKNYETELQMIMSKYADSKTVGIRNRSQGIIANLISSKKAGKRSLEAALDAYSKGDEDLRAAMVSQLENKEGSSDSIFEALKSKSDLDKAEAKGKTKTSASNRKTLQNVSTVIQQSNDSIKAQTAKMDKLITSTEDAATATKELKGKMDLLATSINALANRPLVIDVDGKVLGRVVGEQAALGNVYDSASGAIVPIGKKGVNDTP